MDIIYFKTSNSSFVLTDQKILEKNFSVKSYYINNSNSFKYLIALVKLILFLIIQGWRAKIYFIRFADWHTAILTLFKKIYRKKLIIVVGGFDAFHIPEYSYGVYDRKFRGWCAKYSIKNASLVLPNSPYLVEYTNLYASSKPIIGGIKHFIPNMKGEIKVVANGFDTGFWLKESAQEKKNIVMTVAFIKNQRNFYLKGIDSFIELACLLAEYEFLLVGTTKEFLRNQNVIMNLPANLKVMEFVQPQKLREYYQQAKVFCLFSLTEGMSNVLCEAMLCECIPIGSDVSFIPQIIGPNGFIVYRRDINEMKNVVLKALHSDLSMGKKAKQWIIDNFSLEKRESALTELMREQLKK